MKVSLHDTLIITTSTYRQKVVIIDESLYRKGHEDILLYHKAFMLQEVRVVALNPTYEGFKRDIANAKLPDSYKNLEGLHLTEEDRRNATYNDETPNILKNTAIGSPIMPPVPGMPTPIAFFRMLALKCNIICSGIKPGFLPSWFLKSSTALATQSATAIGSVHPMAGTTS